MVACAMCCSATRNFFARDSSAMKSDGIDAMNQADLKTVKRLSRDPNLNIHETEGTLHFGYAMRCDVAPFDDINVRLALKYGVDRDEFLQKVLQGHGYVGNDHPIGKSQRFFNRDLPQRNFDADKAKFYLKKAGHGQIESGTQRCRCWFRGDRTAPKTIRQK